MSMNPIQMTTPDPLPDPAAAPSVSSENGPRGVNIDVIVTLPDWTSAVRGPEELCRRAVMAACRFVRGDLASVGPGEIECAITLGGDEQVQALNRDYRGMDKPTNVLSFANLDGEDTATPPPGAPLMLGDIVIALETVQREAREENKSLDAHLAHMVVHGFLHLLGYDHQTDRDAEQMEALEAKALAKLGVTNPHTRTGENTERRS